MIDVHCHLQFEKFGFDVAEVVKRAQEAGVHTIINVGTQVSSSLAAIKLAEQYDNLYAIVGVHPHHADKIDSSFYPSPFRRGQGEVKDNVLWLQELEQMLSHPKVLGIGEIGMDYFSYKSNGIVDPARQKDVFTQQLELAIKHKLPLQIHNRHAGKDIIAILKHYKRDFLPIPGQFHCMSGDLELLKQALELGFFIGFDGNITYSGIAPGETTELSELVKYTPLDKLVVETDSPYLTPLPHRGKRNEPQYAILTAHFIADLKGVSFETVVAQTTKNVYTVFSKMRISTN